jgi:hypothetical protein
MAPETSGKKSPTYELHLQEDQPPKGERNMATSMTDQYLGHNERYAASEAVHQPAYPGKQPIQPAKRVAVVACMDARLDVEDLLGLQTGDAHIIRNAGVL